MKTLRVLLFLVAFLPAGARFAAYADEPGLPELHFTAGMFHSLKGVGGSFRFGELNSLSIYADMEEVYAGRALYPGVRVSYLRPVELAKKEASDGSVFTFYAGPGMTCGYVRDKDEWYGLMAGISLGAGVRVCLRERIVLALELEGNAAFVLSKSSLYHTWGMRLYKNGYRQALYPQLKLEYRF